MLLKDVIDSVMSFIKLLPYLSVTWILPYLDQVGELLFAHSFPLLRHHNIVEDIWLNILELDGSQLSFGCRHLELLDDICLIGCFVG